MNPNGHRWKFTEDSNAGTCVACGQSCKFESMAEFLAWVDQDCPAVVPQKKPEVAAEKIEALVQKYIEALVQKYTEEAARTRMQAKESFFLLWMEAYLKRTGADAEDLVLVEHHDPANGKVRYWLEPKKNLENK